MIKNETIPYSFEALRPTVMDVDLGALSANYEVLQARVPSAKVMAVVKANGYGHGLQVVARHFESIGVAYFGVGIVEEGFALREAGVTSPILVFGGVPGNQKRLFLDYDLDFTASSVEKLQAIDAAAHACGKRAKVHLKIDTGIQRVGVQYHSGGNLFEVAANVKNCEVVGVYSHLATAEEEDTSFAKEQLSRFNSVLEQARDSLASPFLSHLLNTGGIISLPEGSFDLVRPGIGLYGVCPALHLESAIDLTPALKLSSRVVYFKVVPPNTGVSYGHKWKTDCQTRVVTVPIGYGDGYSRRMSSGGSVLIRGKRYPVVGSVCMDQFMVNIGEGEAYNDDEVVLIGQQGDEIISVGQIASLVDTVPHDVLTAINMRVPRRYSLNGKEVSMGN